METDISYLKNISFPRDSISVYRDVLLNIHTSNNHELSSITTKNLNDLLRTIFIRNNCSTFWFINFKYLIQHALNEIFLKWENTGLIVHKEIFFKYNESSSDRHNTYEEHSKIMRPRVAFYNSFEYQMAMKYKKLYKNYKRKLNVATKNFKRKVSRMSMGPKVSQSQRNSVAENLS